MTAAPCSLRLQPAAEPAAPVDDLDTADLALTLMASRHNVSPKRLAAPAPTESQLQALFRAAAAAPDHGQITPWRFIIVPQDQRHRLADVFARALLERDAAATAVQVEAAREKAHRAPLLLVAIARLGPREPDIAALERMVSMGAAIQNLLLAAHAMGYGAGLTSGQAMSTAHMHRLCGLADGEVAVCCVNVGTVTQRKPASRLRPLPSDFVSELPDAPDSSGV